MNAHKRCQYAGRSNSLFYIQSLYRDDYTFVQCTWHKLLSFLLLNLAVNRYYKKFPIKVQWTASKTIYYIYTLGNCGALKLNKNC